MSQSLQVPVGNLERLQAYLQYLRMAGTRTDADALLARAIASEQAKDLNASHAYYLQSLDILMDILKSLPPNSTSKVEYLKLIEHHMGEAERVKDKLDKEQARMKQESEQILKDLDGIPDVPPAEVKPQSSSIWSFGSSSSSEPKKKEAPPLTAAARAAGKAGTTANTNATRRPDTHDYTKTAAASRVAKSDGASNSSSRGNSSGGAVSPMRKPGLPSAARGKPAPTATKELVDDKKKATTKGPANEYETQIMSEMLDASPNVHWDDIAGLAFAKQTLQEAVILPNLRPDLFVGLRSPTKGVLLYGPPGTGKTLLAKAVATESGFCFFCITSSSVTSKYLGEGEKLMRGLFEVARNQQPAVIFFDEIDALMGTRKDNEHEASRRLKTEFMTQVDGAGHGSEDRLLIMAATNIPWSIDEAVLRRLAKRIYVPLPDVESRTALITHLLRKQAAVGAAGTAQKGDLLTQKQLNNIVKKTEGYSGSDLKAVRSEVLLFPLCAVLIVKGFWWWRETNYSTLLNLI